MSELQLTSTTAPGKFFSSRTEIADHYKSDWHKYNLKRREAGLPLLIEADFQARLEASLALRREREGREERNGKSHLKKRRNKNKQGNESSNGITVEPVGVKEGKDDEPVQDMNVETVTTSPVEDEAPVIDPRQCLFDKHLSPTIEANLERMQRKYGFFVPDQEYLIDPEGLIGYCHEKVKLGHFCLYCQRVFRTWQGCQKHMVSTRHTKLKYERGVDMEEFDPFFDFSEADAEFLGSRRAKVSDDAMEEEAVLKEDDEWEDVTDDEAEGEEDKDEDNSDDEDEEGLYAGYEDEIAKYGFDVTPLGELVFPDGRIVGHRGLARYYKQRVISTQDRAAVVAARRAAGDRLYNGRVYHIGQQQHHGETNALALSRAGIVPGTATGRTSSGILVASGAGFTALSLYRYRAVVKKAHRDNAMGQRLQYKSKMNMNRMDKKSNRMMNGVSVAHAKR